VLERLGDRREVRSGGEMPGAVERQRDLDDRSRRQVNVDLLRADLERADRTAEMRGLELSLDDRDADRRVLAARDDGLTRTVGVSNYSIGQIDDLIDATGEKPAVNQIPWNPSRYDARLLAAHAERGVALEGYSPLKGTRLRDRTLAEIADKYGVTSAQVVLRWHIDIGVIVIPRSARPERIEQNFDLFGFSLTPEEISRLNNL
jgi:diketogulonate reductase-like aldo/keto reductase